MANRTYDFSSIGGSPVITAKAAADTKSGVAVVLTKDGANLPAAGKFATGIVIPGDETTSKGDDLTIQIRNQGMWTAGAAFDAGTLLAVDAEGLCQKATSGQYILAMALGSATAKGDLVQVAIIHAGYSAA